MLVFFISQDLECYNPSTMKCRVLYNILIFLSIALFAWPVYTSLMIAGVFLFRKFYESIVWLFVIEIFLGPTDVGLWDHKYMLIVGVVLVVSAWCKKLIRYYE